MKMRLLVALLFLPLFAWVIFLSTPLPFLILLVVGVVLAALELGQLIRNRDIRFSYAITLPAILAIVLLAAFPGLLKTWEGQSTDAFWSILMISMLVLSMREVFMGFHKTNFANISANLFAILLVGGIGSFVALLRLLPHGQWWIFVLFGYNWVYDSGALFTGMLLGKHQLAPTISPAKTIEGLAGGLVMNVVLGSLAYAFIIPQAMGFSFLGFVVLGLLIGLCSQAGDLVESLIKRWSGQKDSSAFIPGHGGILDKIDNLIFSAPVLYLFAKLLERL